MLRDDQDFINEFQEQEQLLYLVLKRLCKIEDLNEGTREPLAYRMAEILVGSKNLYTKILPEFLQSEAGEAGDGNEFERLIGMRMYFLHLRDMVEEFEVAFIKALEKDDDEARKG